MAETIYANLELAFILVLVIFVIIYAILSIKKKSSTVLIARVDFAFISITTALFIIRLILAVLIEKSIKIELFCAVCWVVMLVVSFIKLKKTKTTNID